MHIVQKWNRIVHLGVLHEYGLKWTTWTQWTSPLLPCKGGNVKSRSPILGTPALSYIAAIRDLFLVGGNH